MHENFTPFNFIFGLQYMDMDYLYDKKRNMIEGVLVLQWNVGECDYQK